MVFYRFLTEYFLPTYHGQILRADKAVPGTMGLIRCLGDTDFFITPRNGFLGSYSQWLRDQDSPAFDLSAVHADAAVQRKLLEAGIPLRHESNNPSTWRYAFHGKANGNVNCLALPLEELPEAVQRAFGALFGSDPSATDAPSRTGPAPDGKEGGKTL